MWFDANAALAELTGCRSRSTDASILSCIQERTKAPETETRVAHVARVARLSSRASDLEACAQNRNEIGKPRPSCVIYLEDWRKNQRQRPRSGRLTSRGRVKI